MATALYGVSVVGSVVKRALRRYSRGPKAAKVVGTSRDRSPAVRRVRRSRRVQPQDGHGVEPVLHREYCLSVQPQAVALRLTAFRFQMSWAGVSAAAWSRTKSAMSRGGWPRRSATVSVVKSPQPEAYACAYSSSMSTIHFGTP